MTVNSVETFDHLTKVGVAAAEEAAHKPTIGDLDVSKLTIELSDAPRKVPEVNSDEVWKMRTCSDHMVMVDWTVEEGWHAPRIQPYGPMTMSPIASCLHYATQCFEGMKVYRGYDGKLRLFRPDLNAARLDMSSTRVTLPSFNTAEFVKLLKAFMKVDGPKWLPQSRAGNFLYLRPAIIGSGEEIGVQAPDAVTMFIVAVCWPDLGTGVKPGTTPKPPGLKLLASKNDTRAWPGGFGYAKVGANYGPAFVAHMEGRKRGYDQILWLLGSEQFVTEAGSSNFFIVWRTKEGRVELVTAPLDDKIILDGITRRSVIELAGERFKEGSLDVDAETPALDVVERRFAMAEVEAAVKEGRVVESFVTGTAFFITPVSVISFKDEDLKIPMGSDGQTGYYAKKVRQWLTDIKYGNVQHEWGVVVEESS